jgi:hypothetical protein
MFLTQNDFLKEIGAFDKVFSNNPNKFIREVIVLYRNPVSISEFIQNMPSDDKRNQNLNEWISYFHNVLTTNRIEVLSKFYNSYLYTEEIDTLFSKPLFRESLNDLYKNLFNETEKTIYVQRNDKTKRILRNIYAKEILNDTTITNSIKGKPNFWESLYNFFQGHLDDRLFAPSSIHLYLRDKTLQTPIYLLQQYQSKASIINPAVLYTLLNLKLNNNSHSKKLFTPEMSWSSYLLTFLSSGDDWNEYIGVDVMNSVITKSSMMYSLFKSKNPHSKKKVSLIQKPSESLLNNSSFISKYSNSIDTIFYCPPYYDMEIYPDSSGFQSIDQYETYDEWLEKYLFATLKLCSIVLKRGGKLAVMIGNYHKKLNGEFYDLIGDFSEFMKNKRELRLKLIDDYFLKNRTSPLKNNDKLRGEILFIYEKY